MFGPLTPWHVWYTCGQTSESTFAWYWCSRWYPIPETPGSFRNLCSMIWPRNVTEFSYRYESEGKADILISFQPVVNIDNDFELVISKLQENNYDCIDLTNNELAKVHLRHLAGGRSEVPHERLFRFDFPESSGALQRFSYWVWRSTGMCRCSTTETMVMTSDVFWSESKSQTRVISGFSSPCRPWDTTTSKRQEIQSINDSCSTPSQIEGQWDSEGRIMWQPQWLLIPQNKHQHISH